MRVSSTFISWSKGNNSYVSVVKVVNESLCEGFLDCNISSEQELSDQVNKSTICKEICREFECAFWKLLCLREQ